MGPIILDRGPEMPYNVRKMGPKGPIFLVFPYKWAQKGPFLVKLEHFKYVWARKTYFWCLYK